jgi:hypothetical protein
MPLDSQNFASIGGGISDLFASFGYSAKQQNPAAR